MENPAAKLSKLYTGVCTKRYWKHLISVHTGPVCVTFKSNLSVL